MHSPYDEALPFLPSDPLRHQEVGSLAFVQFGLTKHFTYIGLAVQTNAPNIVNRLYNLGYTKRNLLINCPDRTYAWSKAISTIAEALEPGALQVVKDEALHMAAKSALPRTTRILLARGANPNNRPVVRRLDGMVTVGTTALQEVLFHPAHREEGEIDTPFVTLNVCPWRWHRYAVFYIAFVCREDFASVTGCSSPHKRLAIEDYMCSHSALVGLQAVDVHANPRRVYHGYRVIHTLQALLEGGGDMALVTQGQIEVCWKGHSSISTRAANGMTAPDERT